MMKIFLYGQWEKRQNYVRALAAAGAEPVVSWNTEDGEACQGLLLPGGADLDPDLYQAPNQGSQGVDRALDEAEIALVRRFVAANRPILGICRGMQLLNVAFGGTLIQDLPTAQAHRWREADQRHMVRAAPGSFLAGLYGESFPVNSAHHQGVGQPAPGLCAAAWAEDGVVESLEWPEKRIYGVQWHPERATLDFASPDLADGDAVFRFFTGLLGG